MVYKAISVNNKYGKEYIFKVSMFTVLIGYLLDFQYFGGGKATGFTENLTCQIARSSASHDLDWKELLTPSNN